MLSAQPGHTPKRRAPAGVDLSLGDPLVLPRWPVALKRLGMGLTAASMLVGLAWWLSMAWRTWQAGAPWAQLVLAALMLAVCSVAPLRWWSQRPADSSRPLWWHADWMRTNPDEARWGALAGSPWRDRRGEPVSLSVVFDLGPWLLLSVVGRQGHSGIYWMPEARLIGPWRWRVIRSSPEHALVASFPSSQLASSSLLTSNHLAPQSPRSRGGRALS